VIKTAEEVKKLLEPFCTRIEIAGSIRRRDPNPKDVDILCIPEVGEEFLQAINIMSALSERYQVTRSGDRILNFVTQDRVTCHVYFCTLNEWGAILLFLTGPHGSNIGLRIKARKKGWTLNQYGLWCEDKRVPRTNTEREIREALDVEWKEPWERGR